MWDRRRKGNTARERRNGKDGTGEGRDTKEGREGMGKVGKEKELM